MLSTIDAVAASLFVVTLLAVWRKRRQTPGNLPPGPPRKWLLGNILDMPRTEQWLTFSKWSALYGDVVYLEALGNSIVVLNSLEAINDLLDKHALNWSDRPTFTLAGEMMGLDNSTPLLPYGPEWRYHRKITHIALSMEAVKKYHSIQEQHVALFLDSLIDRPENFAEQLRLTAGRIVISVTYGLPINTPDNIYITQAEMAIAMVNKYIVPGGHLVDFLPFLKHFPRWLPFNNIHSLADAGRNQIEAMITRPFTHVKQEMAKGTAAPSFTAELLGSADAKVDETSRKSEEELIKWAASSMYAAGGETTYTTILIFILLMANNPKVQAEAQAEIDAKIGDRLPDVSNRADLPFVEATMKEATRWRPALPLSVARRTKEADQYMGHYIPEKTIVFPNIWALSRDDRTGIPPELFSPDRFFAARTPTGKTALDPDAYIFGFGRRACPGKYLGWNSLWLLISGLLASFEFSQPVDEQGRPVVIQPEYTNGLVSYPKPYKVTIKPRSQAAVTRIRERVAAI